MALKIKNVKKLQEKSQTHKVMRWYGNLFEVVSGTSGNIYTVVAGEQGGTCSCNWGAFRPGSDLRSGCSHMQAVMRHLQADNGNRTSAWVSEADAKRQHRPMVNIGDGVILTLRKAG